MAEGKKHILLGQPDSGETEVVLDNGDKIVYAWGEPIAEDGFDDDEFGDGLDFTPVPALIFHGQVYETDADIEAAMQAGTLGMCDCGKPFDPASTTDHCPEEGTCWPHCTKPSHALGVLDGMMQQKKMKAVASEYVHTFEPPKPLTKSQVLANAAEKEEVALIDHVMREMGAASVDREATDSERVALYLTKIWLTGEGQHAEVVAYSEGITLQQHREQVPGCEVCASLSYYDKALDLLRESARAEVQVAEDRARRAQYAEAEVCVECGQPPFDGRRYTLDEGEGFMCSKCAGPHLIMDDGQPGAPWENA